LTRFSNLGSDSNNEEDPESKERRKGTAVATNPMLNHPYASSEIFGGTRVTVLREQKVGAKTTIGQRKNFEERYEKPLLSNRPRWNNGATGKRQWGEA